MNARVENRKTFALEKSHHAGKEIFLVVRVDKYLADVALAARTALDDGVVRAGASGEFHRVPGDVLGRMAKEVDDVEFLPESVSHIFGHAGLRDQFAGLLAVFIENARPRFGFATCFQAQQCAVVEIREKLILPCVPDLGTGGADVADGQKIQTVESLLVADL